MRSRREPERGGHERGRGKVTKEGKVDAWESSALSGWCSTWHTGERMSRASIRLSSSSASSISSWEIRSPRDPLPVTDVDFGTLRFSAMNSVDFSSLFFVFFFCYGTCALSQRGRETDTISREVHVGRSLFEDHRVDRWNKVRSAG